MVLLRYIKHIILLIGFAVLADSCYIDRAANEICDYNMQLRYDYNEENTSLANMIEYYVNTIDEYIFDAEGVLFQHRRFMADPCVNYMHSQINLPPGCYSVIAVGNRDDRSMVMDANNTGSALETLIPGVTRREDMLLELNNAEAKPDGTSGESERLYHGYKTFTVMPEGISRVRVDMVNAHMKLKFRVTWKNGATPPSGTGYYALLESVPSKYNLMPELIYPVNSFECQKHDPDLHDLYPSSCNSVIHHIPHVCHEQENVLRYRNEARINVDKEMWGEFISYRIKTMTRPKLRIFDAKGVQIVRDVDLQKYFDWLGYDVDSQLKQDYEIDIVIDGDKIIMMPLDVADWEEGGVLGG